MYIIELFVKLKNDIKQGKFRKKETKKPDDEKEVCDHLFVPIDSTGNVLACSKCGMLYKKNKKKVNPFKKDD